MNSNNDAQHLDAEFAQEVFAGSHKFAADEPVSAGGTA